MWTTGMRLASCLPAPLPRRNLLLSLIRSLWSLRRYWLLGGLHSEWLGLALRIIDSASCVQTAGARCPSVWERLPATTRSVETTGANLHDTPVRDCACR